MRFTAKASSQAEFESWVSSVKQSSNTFSLSEYKRLAEPSKDNPIAYYSSAEENLQNSIIMKFMAPPEHMEH